MKYAQIGYLILYSLNGCNACNLIKELLGRYNQEYKEEVVGDDILPDRVNELFPNKICCPLLIKNGEPVGGLIETVLLLKELGYITKKNK